MTPDQISTFRDSGYLLLRSAAARQHVEFLRKHVLGELERLRIWSSGKTLSASIRKLPAFQQIAKLSSLLKLEDLPDRVCDSGIRVAITTLAQAPLAQPQGQFLVSLPNQGEWSLDGLNWHTDVSPSTARIPGIQAFVLLDDVKPRGGGTLAIAGSHLLAGKPGAGSAVRGVLRGSSDLANDLRSHALSIVEMTGSAGDVYLMDMRMLHTPSINSTKRVRLMATVRCLVAE